MPRFGMTAIGSILAADYDVRVLADIYGAVTVDEILQHRPDVVMFNGSKTTTHRVREFALEIKRRAPKLPLVSGGVVVFLVNQTLYLWSDGHELRCLAKLPGKASRVLVSDEQELDGRERRAGVRRGCCGCPR